MSYGVGVVVHSRESQRSLPAVLPLDARWGCIRPSKLAKSDAMSNGIAPPPDPQPAHGIFVGPIDQQASQRIAGALTIAVNNSISHIHMAFQSAGGTVADGVCIYNLLRASPIPITTYNVGSVSSAGVIAYLGAQTRGVSSTGTFMIHKTYLSPIAARVDKLQAFANSATIDDERTESILRGNINLADDKWDS